MKKCKIIKFIQLGVTIAFIVTYFCIICAYPLLRNRVFSDGPLKTLCILMWVFSIVTLIFYLWDIESLLRLMIDNHELNKEAYLDKLTGIPNRHSLDRLFSHYTGDDVLPEVGCGIMRISDIKEINNGYGHDKGDDLIRGFSKILENIGDRYGFVGRNGGNDYIVIIEKCDNEKMETFFKDLNSSIDVYNGNADNIPIRMEYRYLLNKEAKAGVMTDLIGLTYEKWST